MRSYQTTKTEITKVKKLLIAIALFVSLPVAMADEGRCEDYEMKESPNPIIAIVAFPFKMVSTILWGPACLLDTVVPNIDPKDK